MPFDRKFRDGNCKTDPRPGINPPRKPIRTPGLEASVASETPIDESPQRSKRHKSCTLTRHLDTQPTHDISPTPRFRTAGRSPASPTPRHLKPTHDISPNPRFRTTGRIPTPRHLNPTSTPPLPNPPPVPRRPLRPLESPSTVLTVDIAHGLTPAKASSIPWLGTKRPAAVARETQVQVPTPDPSEAFLSAASIRPARSFDE